MAGAAARLDQTARREEKGRWSDLVEELDAKRKMRYLTPAMVHQDREKDLVMQRHS